jgi:hypothetical protein
LANILYEVDSSDTMRYLLQSVLVNWYGNTLVPLQILKQSENPNQPNLTEFFAIKIKVPKMAE